MPQSQILIKIVLIAVLVLVLILLMLPSRGARSQAIRTLALVAFFGAAVVAVIFPDLVNRLAAFFGVGRGADLLLYGLTAVFVAVSLGFIRKLKAQDRKITQLAREMALAGAQKPNTEMQDKVA